MESRRCSFASGVCFWYCGFCLIRYRSILAVTFLGLCRIILVFVLPPVNTHRRDFGLGLVVLFCSVVSCSCLALACCFLSLSLFTVECFPES